mgnify:CR=1 FL=1
MYESLIALFIVLFFGAILWASKYKKDTAGVVQTQMFLTEFATFVGSPFFAQFVKEVQEALDAAADKSPTLNKELMDVFAVLDKMPVEQKATLQKLFMQQFQVLANNLSLPTDQLTALTKLDMTYKAPEHMPEG